MAVSYTNLAQTTLQSGITASQTTIPLLTGSGSAFPSPGAGQWSTAILVNAGGTYEIVKITGRTGDTLTVVRAQEGTAGFAFSAGDKCECRLTAAGLANKLDIDTGGTIAGALTVTGGITSALTGPVTGNASTASALQNACTLSISGDLTWSSGNFDGSANVTAAGTLATVNANVGTFGGAASIPSLTVNAKGLVTAASVVAIPTAAAGTPGLVALATAAMAAAGTDNAAALTAAALASLVGNGYIEFPGKVFLFYGQSASIPGLNQTGTVAVSLPGGVTLSTGILAVAISRQSQTTQAQGADVANGYSTTGFTIQNNGWTASAFGYIAIGK